MSISITSTIGFVAPLYLLEAGAKNSKPKSLILFGGINLLSGLNDLRTKQKLVITTKQLDTEDADGNKEVLYEKKVYNTTPFNEYSAAQIAIGGLSIVVGLLHYQEVIGTEIYNGIIFKLIPAAIIAEIFSYFMLDTHSEILERNDGSSSIVVIEQGGLLIGELLIGELLTWKYLRL